MIGNLSGMRPKVGSMGKPVPGYDVDIIDHDGNPVGFGEVGEIVLKLDKGRPCGLMLGYWNNETGKPEMESEDGYFHTGDTAWRDEDGIDGALAQQLYAVQFARFLAEHLDEFVAYDLAFLLGVAHAREAV